MRRQSAGLKAEKPEPTKDSLEVVEVKDDISHLQENLANENGPASLGSKVHEEAREATECNCTQLVSFCYFIFQFCYIKPCIYCLYAASRPTNPEQVHVKKNVEKKR